MRITFESSQNMLFTISAFAYSLLILIMFLRKKKVNTIENYTYAFTISCVVLQLGISLLIFNISMPTLSLILRRINHALFIVWGFSLTYYFLVIVSDENQGYISFKENPKKNYFLKLLRNIGIIGLIATSMIFILPYEAVNGLYITAKGLAVTYSYAAFGVLIVIWFILFFKSKKKEVRKQFLPIIFCIFLVMIFVVIQMFIPTLRVTTSVAALGIGFVYIVMANPDLNMIEELNMVREGVDRANKAKSDFLSNMTHEIRTPLNAIVGFSEALAEEEMSEENKEDVQIINSSAVNLLEIVNGILDISKIDSGKLELTKSTYILNKLINEVIIVSNRRKGKKNIEIRANVNSELPQVLSGDVVKIKTILTSIVSNAIKYSEKGIINIDVDGYVKEDKCRIIINIEDEGKGIKKEVIENLFTKYEVGSNDGSIEGSGLGVALTKKLVELMGGKIHVKSGEGVGTSFILAIDQEVIAKTSNEVEGIYSEELQIYDLSGKRILVVDDNGVNLKVAKRLLKEYKIEVDLSKSGEECIEKIKTNKYDLIMMDDFMPVMDGPTTLNNLKQISGFNIPVIALTANNESDSKAKYISLGFNNYLSKPISKEELNKTLKEYLV